MPGRAPATTSTELKGDTMDCAYCPLGITEGHEVMLDGHPAHPDCAEACEGLDLPAVRKAVAERDTSEDDPYA